MKKKAVKIPLLLTILVASCSLPFEDSGSDNYQVKDIPQYSEFAEIRTLPFMGGALYYSESKTGKSAIVPGADIAFRLGYTTHEELNDHYYFTDHEEQAKYGLMEIENVDNRSISLNYILFDSKGNVLLSDSRSTGLGREIDLDNDGYNDLIYSLPVVKRPGLEDCVYLNFISSMEEDHTAMYSIIKEQYRNGDYPNGLMGINNNGRFIFSKYGEGSRGGVECS